MSRANVGDTVRVRFTGRLEDGSVFDTSARRGPLEFTIGAGQVIPGVEQAVEGMEPGQSKSATIPPEQAYGHRRDEMIATVDRDRLPKALAPTVGQRLSVQGTDGRQFEVTVADVTESTVTLDANHLLAGETLVFELELLEVK